MSVQEQTTTVLGDRRGYIRRGPRPVQEFSVRPTRLCSYSFASNNKVFCHSCSGLLKLSYLSFSVKCGLSTTRAGWFDFNRVTKKSKFPQRDEESPQAGWGIHARGGRRKPPPCVRDGLTPADSGVPQDRPHETSHLLVTGPPPVPPLCLLSHCSLPPCRTSTGLHLH